MEEKLRLYFLNNGYYVARGVKYSFKGNEITDIDLFLYGRVSGLTRERANVDIKNKKTPKAFERILWAKGLQNLLGFDNCVVATSDKKDAVRKYGIQNKITILDGNFLQKLNYSNLERLTEEELLTLFSSVKSYNVYRNITWNNIYEKSKSRLLDELDFSGLNSNLITLKYFVNKCFDKQKKEIALRAVYIILSHSLLILDYILKNIAFLDPHQRKVALSEGFKYGNLGSEGVNQTIIMAIEIAKSKKTLSQIKMSLESDLVDLLPEYFYKVEAIKNVFKWALIFELRAYEKNLILPNNLDSELKAPLGIILDYCGVSRKDFFNLF
ncbi:MAG: hypothetical protein N4A35_17030 [Flavobacteriales bacterium]|nr:hypothetical protein [Flavobacteriales bacterium]